jgi:hypothetical protein
MSTLVLTINPDGAGSCLYSELIDLQSIGSLDIRRASHIEFNNTTQRWEVKNLRGNVLFFAKTRIACVEWEHENVST